MSQILGEGGHGLVSESVKIIHIPYALVDKLMHLHGQHPDDRRIADVELFGVAVDQTIPVVREGLGLFSFGHGFRSMACFHRLVSIALGWLTVMWFGCVSEIVEGVNHYF